MNTIDKSLTRDQLVKVAKILKIIAHPVKLEILQVLRISEKLDVTSLCREIGAECEISMMSHHLAKLRDNGVVKSEKHGKQVFYSMADKTILKLFDCMHQCTLI